MVDYFEVSSQAMQDELSLSVSRSLNVDAREVNVSLFSDLSFKCYEFKLSDKQARVLAKALLSVCAVDENEEVE
ncbi:hypothetical protein B9G54_01635 [Alloscardovia macacae]|uniref:Uncharacterized protein n=1 Tax=Alloscardovia macacae TaxID=1160091 RepID=A0A1Y2SYW3_9BIFI|nr:hypothetical protein [Alloscardovia macacae]OTA27247.1 hypothetical protein B9G54_01635 [Alloscardovia macacae]OTA29257.1 hypothetical protein B9T39_03830 [Alloscardovia macacae]